MPSLFGIRSRISITVSKFRSEFPLLFRHISFVVFVKERSNSLLTWLIRLTLLSATSFSHGKWYPGRSENGKIKETRNKSDKSLEKNQLGRSHKWTNKNPNPTETTIISDAWAFDHKTASIQPRSKIIRLYIFICFEIRYVQFSNNIRLWISFRVNPLLNHARLQANIKRRYRVFLLFSPVIQRTLYDPRASIDRFLTQICNSHRLRVLYAE